MSSEKRYRQIGQGEFIKWTDAGQKVEGVWRGHKDGQYGPLGIVDTSRGRVTFPLHTALLDKVQDLAEGTEVEIIYMGERPTKRNPSKSFKAFNVGVLEEPQSAQPAESADDVPF